MIIYTCHSSFLYVYSLSRFYLTLWLTLLQFLLTATHTFAFTFSTTSTLDRTLILSELSTLGILISTVETQRYKHRPSSAWHHRNISYNFVFGPNILSSLFLNEYICVWWESNQMRILTIYFNSFFKISGSFLQFDTMFGIVEYTATEK